MRLNRRRRRARVTITIIIMVLREGAILLCSSKVLEDFKGADCGGEPSASQDGASWASIPRAQSPGESEGAEDGNFKCKLAPDEMLLGSGDKEEDNILTLVGSRRGENVEYFCGEKDEGSETSKCS